MFCEIVTRTKQLHIRLGQRCSTFGERNYVIKVQFISGSTDGAFTAITLPNLQLYGRWNHAPTLSIESSRLSEVFFSFDCHQSKLEHQTMFVLLLPGVR